MIPEYILMMWVELYQAGYRPALPTPERETWLEYLERAKRVVAEYRADKER